MALKILRSIFAKPPGIAPAPRTLAPGEAVMFITIVDRAYAIEPHQNLESDQASMRLRVGIPARELARRARVACPARLRACAATAPSAALRERLARDARHGVAVIEDPYESAVAGTPRFSPGERLQLAWFDVFERYASIGDDLSAGVEWALSHPREVETRIATGQQYSAGRLAPEVVGARWAEVLGLAAAKAEAPA